MNNLAKNMGHLIFALKEITKIISSVSNEQKEASDRSWDVCLEN